jgi:hypothetical protein
MACCYAIAMQAILAMVLHRNKVRRRDLMRHRDEVYKVIKVLMSNKTPPEGILRVDLGVLGVDLGSGSWKSWGVGSGCWEWTLGS